jgi:hypothetical protein
MLSVAAAATVGASVGTAACSSGNSPVLPFTPTTPVPQPVPTQETFVVTGRPLRRRRGRIHFARSRTQGLWVTDAATLALPRDVRTLLAEHWRQAGEMEHASVIAFGDLSRRLRRVRATHSLVERAERAAAQEQEHARRCFELASRYAGRRIAAGRLRLPLRRPHRRAHEITALAVEALRDGVVNEGYAAWLAGAQLDRACDSEVRDTLTVIAADEAEHAELSRDVLEWCLLNGDAAAQAAVDLAFAELPHRMTRPTIPAAVPRPAQVVLAAHGLVDVDPDGVGYRQVIATLMV